MTEIERLCLAAKDCIVQFLPLYNVIISNVHVIDLCSFTCTDVHVKRFYVHEIHA